MEVKLFEIRDRMTFIPVIAIKLTSDDPAERYLLKRAGYDATTITGHHIVNKEVLEAGQWSERYVLLTKLDGGACTYDPYQWVGKARTMPIAHQHIINNWDDLTSGEVIDVEFIKNESSSRKVSERAEHGEI